MSNSSKQSSQRFSYVVSILFAVALMLLGPPKLVRQAAAQVVSKHQRTVGIAYSAKNIKYFFENRDDVTPDTVLDLFDSLPSQEPNSLEEAAEKLLDAVMAQKYLDSLTPRDPNDPMMFAVRQAIIVAVCVNAVRIQSDYQRALRACEQERAEDVFDGPGCERLAEVEQRMEEQVEAAARAVVVDDLLTNLEQYRETAKEKTITAVTELYQEIAAFEEHMKETRMPGVMTDAESLLGYALFYVQEGEDEEEILRALSKMLDILEMGEE